MQLNYFVQRIHRPLKLGTAMLLASILSACSTVSVKVPAAVLGTTDCSENVRLDVSQVCKVRVDADKVCVPLEIATLVGDRYEIQVPQGQFWKDWTRPDSNPSAGESGSWLMNLFARFRRIPEEPWMVLGMTTSTCMEKPGMGVPCASTHVRVGSTSSVLNVSEPVKISFFANDVPLLNWNNRGSVWVTVMRLPTTEGSRP